MNAIPIPKDVQMTWQQVFEAIKKKLWVSDRRANKIYKQLVKGTIKRFTCMDLPDDWSNTTEESSGENASDKSSSDPEG